MAFAGFVSSGLVPAAAGALKGRNIGRQQAEEQRRYETEQAQLASQTKWRQQQALEAAQRQAMMDALAQQAQEIGAKGGVEGREIQRQGMEQQAAQADLNRRNAIEIARLGAQSRENVAGIGSKGRIEAKLAGGTDGGGPAKTLPASVATPLFENRRSLETIRRAKDAIVARPDAFGLQNVIPGYDYLDSRENVAARAPVANIGSLVIHDRSGAAVTISEYPRLRPFIPTANDPPAKAAEKLKELEREIRAITDDMSTYYSGQGYAVPGGEPTQSGPVAPGGAGKVMSQRAYEAAKANGYSDEEIRAEGWEIQP